MGREILSMTSHDHWEGGVTPERLAGPKPQCHLGTRCLRPGPLLPAVPHSQFQGCSGQGKKSPSWGGGEGVAGAPSTPARTKTGSSPGLEAVYLQAAVFARAIVLLPPGSQRLSVCLPCPLRGLCLWPPPGPHACANPLALCRGIPHHASEQILLQTKQSGQRQFRGPFRRGVIQQHVKHGRYVL